MPIKFSCKNCQAEINAKDSLAGQTRKCPGCKSPVTVPAVGDLALIAELGDVEEFHGRVLAPSDTILQPTPTPEILAKYERELNAQPSRPSRAQQDKWEPFGYGVHLVNTGSVIWCVTLGGTLLGVIFVLCAAFIFGAAYVVFGTAAQELMGVNPDHTDVGMWAGTGAAIGTAVALAVCLRFIVATCDEYFWPFIGFVLIGLALVIGALCNGMLVIFAGLTLAMIASQSLVLWGWIQSFKPLGLPGRIALCAGIVLLSLSIALALIPSVRLLGVDLGLRLSGLIVGSAMAGAAGYAIFAVLLGYAIRQLYAKASQIRMVELLWPSVLILLAQVIFVTVVLMVSFGLDQSASAPFTGVLIVGALLINGVMVNIATSGTRWLFR